MKPFSWGLVAATGAVGLAVGAGLSLGLMAFTKSPLLITPWLGLLFLLLGAGILAGGLAVRRFKRGSARRLTAIQAARVALFARSAIFNGAAFVGFLGGIAAVGLMRLWAPATAASAVGAGIACVGALVMMIIAILVERWCRDDAGDRPDSKDRSGQRRNRGLEGTAGQTEWAGDK